MACVWSFSLQWGTLCSLLTFLFAQDTLWDCSEKDELLREIPADLDVPSECTLGCTAQTYRKVLELQEKLTVRFKDSYTGKSEEYCWSTKIKCSPGQRLETAFVLFPVDLSLMDGETLKLQISSTESSAESVGETLQQHTGHSLLPSDCGLRFSVTQQLIRKKHQLSLCTKILSQHNSIVGKALRCPPFLVTIWKHWNQSEG